MRKERKKFDKNLRVLHTESTLFSIEIWIFLQHEIETKNEKDKLLDKFFWISLHGNKYNEKFKKSKFWKLKETEKTKFKGVVWVLMLLFLSLAKRPNMGGFFTKKTQL